MNEVERNWKLGASVKEFSKLIEYAENFGFLELDLEHNIKEGENIYSVLGKALPYREKIYSIHLRYKPQNGKNGIETSCEDVDSLMKNGSLEEFGTRIFVTHSDYPTNPEEFRKQVASLGEKACQYGIIIAVENLCDRTNKTNGFMAPRNPKEIAALLEQIDNPYLGLCLDTGHAISNSELTEKDSLDWNTEEVRKWLRHVHYNDNLNERDEHGKVIRRDKHMPISPETDKKLIANIESLTQNSSYCGVMMLEHRKFDEVLQSKGYLKVGDKNE